LRDNARLSKGDYLHFILCFLVLLGAIPYITSDIEHKLTLARYIASNDWSSIKYRPNAIFPPMFNRTLRPIHLLAYSLLIWVTIYQYRAKLFRSSNHSSDFQITKKWLLVFSGFVPLMALFHVFIFYGTTLADTKANFILESYPLLVAFSVVYIAMIASLLFFPHVIYGLPVKVLLPSENLIPQPVAEYSPIEAEYENRPEEVEDVQPSGAPAEKFVQLFSEAYLDEVKSKLQAWTELKHFLDPDTTISTLAVQIKIPQHHLSYYFNTILETKFTDWRNSLKIEYAVSLFEKGVSKSLTLEAIGVQCGYASQSTFIRAFKKAKGMTPTEYMKSKG
jgi:AraC-like DNA-binding protein